MRKCVRIVEIECMKSVGTYYSTTCLDVWRKVCAVVEYGSGSVVGEVNGEDMD